MAGFEMPAEITQKIGPLPAFAWVGIAGVGIALMSKLKKPAAQGPEQTQLNPGAFPSPLQSGNMPGTSAGATLPTVPGAQPGQYNLPFLSLSGADGSAQFAPATYNQTLTDVLGGTLDKFVGGLANAPNDIRVTLPGGTSFETQNGIATFGGGAGNPLLSPEYQKNQLDYINQGYQNYYTAYTNNKALDTQAAKDYQTSYGNNLKNYYDYSKDTQKNQAVQNWYDPHQ